MSMVTTERQRDEFAMAALTGIVAAQLSRDELNNLSDGIKGGMIEARAAYALADAMMAFRARAKP